MPRQPSITAWLSFGVLFSIVGAVTLLITFTLMLVFRSGVPVKGGLELWYINPTYGWELVLPAGGTALDVFASEVVGIAPRDNGFVVRERDGSTVIVSVDKGAWKARPASPGDLDEDTLHLRKPGDLRQTLILKEFWWVFLLEASVLALAGIALAPRRGRRDAPSP